MSPGVEIVRMNSFTTPIIIDLILIILLSSNLLLICFGSLSLSLSCARRRVCEVGGAIIVVS